MPRGVPNKKVDDADNSVDTTDHETDDSRTPEQKERDRRRELAEEHGFARVGTEDDPYGRTNHAMTADEVAQRALEEGTLRPDGRPKNSLFYDDVAKEREDRHRDFVENQQWDEEGNRAVNQDAIRAASSTPVAERGEPIVDGRVITSSTALEGPSGE